MRNIGLALQGGGAYAAFTTGVLNAMFDTRDRFLDPYHIHSVTGTSEREFEYGNSNVSADERDSVEERKIEAIPVRTGYAQIHVVFRLP